MKKLFAMLVCLSLLKCGGWAGAESAIVTPAGELPIVTEPYTLTIAIPVPATVENIAETKLTQWLEEQTGITLEFIELSPADSATQINMMMNSGELPDLFLAYDFPYDALATYVDAAM